jgi:hypothetical protein
MILDKKGKLFGKISIVDVIIVMLIIVVAVGTYVRFNTGRINEPSNEIKVSYKISLEGVRVFSYDALIKDLANEENIGYGDNGIIVGKIVDVQKEEYSKTLLKSDGENILAKFPDDYFKIIITVEANATYSNGGYVVNSINIRKGDLNDFNFATKTVSVAGKVVDVSEI